MAKPSKKAIAGAVLSRYGQTYCEELKIQIGRNSPSPLFRALVAALLFSARISTNIAVAAARALFDKGWTTPEKMAGATWSQRTKTLNRAGYARYDERTSTMLAETSEIVLDRWGGDLRKLREEAERNPDEERELLKELKGIGDVGVDIFFREVQVAWDEVFPFADRRVLKAAEKLDLGKDAKDLQKVVGKKEFPHLVAGLYRLDNEGAHDDILAEAASR